MADVQKLVQTISSDKAKVQATLAEELPFPCQGFLFLRPMLELASVPARPRDRTASRWRHANESLGNSEQ